MKEITPTSQVFQMLLVTLQKARSVAAEGGYQSLPLPALRWIQLDGTVELMADLADGTRTADGPLWANIITMLKMSPTWLVGINAAGYDLPTDQSFGALLGIAQSTERDSEDDFTRPYGDTKL